MRSPGQRLLNKALTPERVLITDAPSKEDLLYTLVGVLGKGKHVKDVEALRHAIAEREKLMSTGIGLGVAVPHARLAAVEDISIACALNRRILPDYESIDGGPVRLVFMVAARPDQQADYVRVLATFSQLVKSESNRDTLFHAESSQALYDLLTDPQK